MLLKSFAPGPVFQKFEHLWPERGKPQVALVGSSASAICWIPYYDNSSQLPDGPLRTMWDTEAYLPPILKSGNQCPPDSFSGPLEFERHLNQKDYRAALSIDQPTLLVDASGGPVRLEFMAMASIGYTHVRPRFVTRFLGRVETFEPGIGSQCGDISEGPNSVIVRAFVRFKLGRPAQIVAKAMTGQWPPSATLMVEYEMSLSSKTCTVHCSGTSIPSRRLYMDWRVDTASDHRIEMITRPSFQQFQEAPGCQDAMTAKGNLTTDSLKPTPISTDLNH